MVLVIFEVVYRYRQSTIKGRVTALLLQFQASYDVTSSSSTIKVIERRHSIWMENCGVSIYQLVFLSSRCIGMYFAFFKTQNVKLKKYLIEKPKFYFCKNCRYSLQNHIKKKAHRSIWVHIIKHWKCCKCQY